MIDAVMSTRSHCARSPTPRGWACAIVGPLLLAGSWIGCAESHALTLDDGGDASPWHAGDDAGAPDAVQPDASTPTAGSCVEPEVSVCVDYTSGWTADMAMSLCGMLGTYSPDRCAIAGRIAHCHAELQVSGMPVVAEVQAFPPSTLEMAQGLCDGALVMSSSGGSCVCVAD